jgi:hypothetical protein
MALTQDVRAFWTGANVKTILNFIAGKVCIRKGNLCQTIMLRLNTSVDEEQR